MPTDPLQNRVFPDGSIVSTPHRGTLYGNRGGKIHDSASRTLLPNKRWASRQWICCVLEFKDRRRPLMGPGYTEMFFLDEVTALAAGHRPCFECRRKDALRFAHAWRDDGSRETAPEMDRVLHRQRLMGKSKALISKPWSELPFGSMISLREQFIAKSADGPLRWSMQGYSPIGKDVDLPDVVDCLTPEAILTTLANGYTPKWHPSACLDTPSYAQI
ncbi:MAG: hypothetical protein ABJH63_09330 [Rhizobiaceae bacterium]